MSATAPRIPLLERDQVTPETQAIYDALLAQRGVVPNMFKVLSYNPSIAAAMAGFLKALLSDGALKGWYKELIAVRISTLMQSEYVIKAHSASVRNKGASEEQIAGVPDFEKGPYSGKEKLVFRLAARLSSGPQGAGAAFLRDRRKKFSAPG